MEQMIREAVARGWCDPANSHKEMDAILAESLVREVMQSLSLESVREEALEEAARIVKTKCGACASYSVLQSPARVAEGVQVAEAQGFTIRGPQAHQIAAALNAIPPESPAKEQPQREWVPNSAWFTSADLSPCKRCGAQRTSLPDDLDPGDRNEAFRND